MKKMTFIILVLISILVNIFVYNDDFIYKKDILKIKKIENIEETESINSIGFKEKYYTQKITGVYTNKKGSDTILYTKGYSSVTSENYKVNDKVFVKDNSIIGLKRDFYVSLMISIFIISIYIVGNIQGLLSILSVTINSFIFYIGLLLYFKGINLLFICVVSSIIFTFISLIIANGKNKKTLSAIISTISTFLVLFVLLFILTKITNYSGITFNELSYLTVPIDTVILPELLIGILGVSMDVAITISTSTSELIEKNNKISIKDLNKSSKEIGKDIMSTMSSVLFFTYICAGLPFFVLALRNGFTFDNYIHTYLSLEMTRFLVGSIAIILTIPVSSYISIKIMKGSIK